MDVAAVYGTMFDDTLWLCPAVISPSWFLSRHRYLPRDHQVIKDHSAWDVLLMKSSRAWKPDRDRMAAV